MFPPSIFYSFVSFFAICNFAFSPIFWTKSILPIGTFSVLFTIVNALRKFNVSDAVKKNSNQKVGIHPWK
jgi:hypothetical protein